MIRSMLQACDTLPLNFGITGKGNDSEHGPLREQVEAGVCGLKLHEDWGASHYLIGCTTRRLTLFRHHSKMHRHLS